MVNNKIWENNWERVATGNADASDAGSEWGKKWSKFNFPSGLSI